MGIREDVIVFGDSRIIDEVNGYCQPLDEICNQWVKILRRDVLPTIRSVVFFRKKPASFIRETIAREHARMLPSLDINMARRIALKAAEHIQTITQNRRKQSRDRLRKSWFGDKKHE